jgi:hypothetical protein
MNRTDVFLRIEVIKKSMLVFIVFFGVQLGVLWMLQATLIFNLITFLIHAWWTSKFLNYPIKEQLSNLIIPIFFGAFIFLVVLGVRVFLCIDNPLLFLLEQLAFASASFLILMRFFFTDYFNILLSLLKIKSFFATFHSNCQQGHYILEALYLDKHQVES